MAKELILAWTRDFTLCWAQWWSLRAHPRLIEVFGAGISYQLSCYTGRVLETYRLVDEVSRLIDCVANADSALFGNEAIGRYVATVQEMRTRIHACEEEGDYDDLNSFLEIQTLAAEMYPWYMICFLLPQESWAAKLREKYPEESQTILARLIDARVHTEGAIGELVEYWRSVASGILSARHLSPRFASFVTYRELEHMRTDTTFIPDARTLERRSKGYLYIPDTVYTDISKEEFFKKHGLLYHPASIHNDRELQGVVACQGGAVVKGIVQIILNNEEVKDFEKGKVLVTVMTTPFFLSAMREAVAIITDEGGVTCHAAINAREIGTPCIIATKHATKILKNGDHISVDTVTGRIMIDAP